MAESIVEKCAEQVSNRFRLALLASQRTHDLNTGASTPTQAARFKNHKNTIVSLYEIAENQISIHELFNLLVNRCKEYMKGNTNSIHSSHINKLDKLLNFSDNQLNANLDADQDDEVDDEIYDNSEIDEEIDDKMDNE
ncbi:DNA-directed RNA polymerase subunit omega [Wolbachia endosymbiont of Ctenocephalides felis wCfeT]|uniref:DNA-directed RNA polymerase subunit omega n=1 Tax=Wolbachia endosymbiont of Ctenocephalides felis wCfeT TaxID=2732593 RepID=UPI0014489684|nr:DNA-directed RNA polymerase subunit omega [Wolbachia endosymbiont of Ctenocephalides felis wCfeT]